MGRRIRRRGMPTLADPFLREAEQLFESILNNGDTPHAKFFVGYALDVCEYRRIVLGLLRRDGTNAILEVIAAKEGVAEKLGISDEMLEGVNRMIAAKDQGTLEDFLERLAKFEQKGEG